jgi:hypothetical protein
MRMLGIVLCATLWAAGVLGAQLQSAERLVVSPPDETTTAAFGPFDAIVFGSIQELPFVSFFGRAQQQSDVQADGVTAVSEVTATGFSSPIFPGVPGSASTLDVVFAVAAPTPWAFFGTLEGRGGPTTVLFLHPSALVRLSVDGGAPLVERSAVDDEQTEVLDSGVLAPGTYRLEAEAIAAGDVAVFDTLARHDVTLVLGDCQGKAEGAACATGDVCAPAGTCTAGACVPGAPAAPAGTPCDSDGSVCTEEACDGAGTCATTSTVACAPCERCDAGAGCVADVRDTCAAADAARLVLRDRAGEERDQLAWRWRGAGTAADFGDPLATDAYTLCLFDESAAPAPFVAAAVPPGGTCSGRPCWTARGAGRLRYKDRSGAQGGVVSIALRARPSGRTSIAVKAKGETLDLPALPAPLPLRVQLRAGDGACWEAAFSPADAVRSDASRLTARLP